MHTTRTLSPKTGTLLYMTRTLSCGRRGLSHRTDSVASHNFDVSRKQDGLSHRTDRVASHNCDVSSKQTPIRASENLHPCRGAPFRHLTEPISGQLLTSKPACTQRIAHSMHSSIVPPTRIADKLSQDLTSQIDCLHCRANSLQICNKFSNRIARYTPCLSFSNPDMKLLTHKSDADKVQYTFGDQCLDHKNKLVATSLNNQILAKANMFSHVYQRNSNFIQGVCFASYGQVVSRLPQIRWIGLSRDTTGLLSSSIHTSVQRFYSTGVGDDDSANSNSQAFCDYLAHLVREYETLSKMGGRKERELELRYVVDCIKALDEKKDELKEVEKLLQGGDSKEDEEMKKLAEEEIDVCKESIDELQDEIVSLLTPPKEIDEHDILLELSAGVGGQEAMLFTSDMFNMYEKYAAYKGWRFKVIEYNTTDIGGVRSAVVSISGHQVNRFMKYEGGVHRVQRVPKTEKAGRMHTSTMTIAVLPQPKQIEIKIDKKDLRIDTFKATGAGGQHVNTTDSAVRLVHIPTGVTVECQQERSQLRNKSLALEVLKVRLYNLKLQRHIKNERSLRKEQVGMAECADKIRTYNFRDNRITDHRAGVTTHQLDDFMDGGEELDDMIEKLIDVDQLNRLRDLIENFKEGSDSGMALR